MENPNRVRKCIKKYNDKRFFVWWWIFFAIMIFPIIHLILANQGDSGGTDLIPVPPPTPNPPPNDCPAVCPPVTVQDSKMITDPTASQGTFESATRRYGSDGGIRELQDNDPTTFAPAKYLGSQCNLDNNFAARKQALQNSPDPLGDIQAGKPVQSSGNVVYSYEAHQNNGNQVTRTSLVKGEVQIAETRNPDFPCDQPVTFYKNQTTNCTTSAVNEPIPMSAFQAGLETDQTGFVVQAKSNDPSDKRVCGTTFKRLN